MAKLCRYFYRGKIVPIFYKQTEVGDRADSWCEILHICTTKNEKLLYTYVKAAVKSSPFQVHDTPK